MLARDVLLLKCEDLSNMVMDLYSANVENETKFLELDSAIIAVKQVDGIAAVPDLARLLQTINIRDWNGYQQTSVTLLSIFLSFLCDKMSQEDWDADVDDIDDYQIFDCQESKGVGNIFYSSPDDPGNDMIIFNCERIEQIPDFLSNKVDAREMIIRVLSKMDIKQKYESLLLTKNGNGNEKIASKIEYIKLFAVLNGETFHITPSLHCAPISVPVKYDDAIEYSQYSEIIDVMNEFNAQDHIIDKYVKIYQVIENFMFKKLLCDKCAEKNYSRLTLRDFKDISEKFESSEKTALYGFLASALSVVVDGISFQQRLKDSWTNLFVTNNNLAKARNYVQSLSINDKNGHPKEVAGIELHDDKLVSLFKDMIYATRCSIVHNKVNEYHITYMNLDDDIKWVMEYFLIPNLKDLSYGLMLNQNNVVMYQQKIMYLY